MDEPHCFIPVLCSAILALVSNLSMVIHIFKANYQTRYAGFTFKFIGISNATCSICMAFRVVITQASPPLPLVWVAATATVISLFLQLGFNVSLAFERHQIMRYAVRYQTKAAKEHLGKKISLVVFALSTSFGFFFSTLRFLFSNNIFIFIPLAVSRITAYILLCVLYIKLYFTIKSSNQTIVISLADQRGTSTCNNQVVIRRKKQLEHSRKFFFAITSTFFFLDLPITVAFFSIYNENPSCSSSKGMFSAIATSLSLLNMGFDSVWYFYMHRRPRKA